MKMNIIHLQDTSEPLYMFMYVINIMIVSVLVVPQKCIEICLLPEKILNCKNLSDFKMSSFWAIN